MSNPSRSVNKNDWSEFEEFIRENMQPVRPRESFVDSLRQDLKSGNFPEFPGVDQTLDHILTLLFLVTILAVIAFIVRVVVGLLASFRSQH